MKKIVIVNNNLNTGGIQKALVNLLEEIKSDYDITLILFSKSGALIDQIPHQIKILEVKSLYRYLGIVQSECKTRIDSLKRGLLAFIAKSFGFKWAVKIIGFTQNKLREHYDYAISYQHCAAAKSFYGGSCEFVLKHIRAEQKICYIHCDYLNSGLQNKYNDEIYARFDKIVGVSESVAKRFNEAAPQLMDKTITVHNCINYENIRNMAMNNPVIYDDSFFNIITVARCSKEKGIERVINAIKDMPMCRYYIVGDGGMLNQYKKSAHEANVDSRVYFCGEQSNPYRFIKNADLFVLPSYHEAAPIVFSEAACLGVPVLATETTSTDEMLVSKKHGFMCLNSQEGITNAIKNIIDNRSSLKEIKNSLLHKSFHNKDAASDFHSMLNP